MSPQGAGERRTTRRVLPGPRPAGRGGGTGFPVPAPERHAVGGAVRQRQRGLCGERRAGGPGSAGRQGHGQGAAAGGGVLRLHRTVA